jgi:hypothetical protein
MFHCKHKQSHLEVSNRLFSEVEVDIWNDIISVDGPSSFITFSATKEMLNNHRPVDNYSDHISLLCSEVVVVAFSEKMITQTDAEPPSYASRK